MVVLFSYNAIGDLHASISKMSESCFFHRHICESSSGIKSTWNKYILVYCVVHLLLLQLHLFKSRFERMYLLSYYGYNFSRVVSSISEQ